MPFIHQEGPRPVSAEGPKTARLAFVGEAPGVEEAKLGRPFVGPAGGLFDTCLRAAGIIRSQCYITNLVKTLPGTPKAPTDISKYYTSKTWTLTSLGQSARDKLVEELKETQAEVIVALGGPAISALTGARSPLKWRGSVIPTAPGLFDKPRKVLCSLHPAYSLRGNYTVRYTIVADFQKAVRHLDPPTKFVRDEFAQILGAPERRLVVEMTFQEALAWIEHFKAQPEVAFDIEVTNHEVSCISFCSSPELSVSIPFFQYWTEEQEIILWRAIEDLLSDPKITKIGQNITGFDNSFLAQRNGILVRGKIKDTMVAQHIMYPDFPKGLDFITSIRTDEPYYKDEGKQWRNVKDWPRFRRYNALDSATTLEASKEIWEELQETGYERTYEMTERIFPVILYMSCRGIRANKERLAETRVKVQKKIDALQEELNKVVGHPLNPQSSKQCIAYFYGELGLAPYTKTKYADGEYSSAVTCDDKALQRMCKPTSTRPAIPAAKIVQELRGLLKLKGTYLDIDFDADGRLRCAINPRGTVTGRLSTQETVFETGTNMQNLPPEMKVFLEADPGNLLFELDKRQAEWVVVAFVSGDASMIKVVRENIDPHAYTASLMSGLSVELIKAEAKVIGHTTDPETVLELRKSIFTSEVWKEAKWLPRNMSLRQAGKKSNHGLNYDEGALTFALTNEIEVKEATTMIDLYHKAYPGVRHSFHEQIRKQLAEGRTLINPFGRKRRFMDRWDQDLFKAAYAHLPQSTVVDMLNLGMADVYDDQEDCAEVDPLMQVHDSFLYQHPIGANNDRWLKMAKAAHKAREYFSPKIQLNGREFMIETDMKIGLNWGEMLEISFGSSMEETARNIEQGYLKLTTKKD